MNGADVSMVIYRRLYQLAKVLDEKEFINRAEELCFVLEKTRMVTECRV